MKLSDLKDDEVEVLKLSELSPDEVEQIPEQSPSLGQKIASMPGQAAEYVGNKLKATGENLVESGEDLAKGITQGSTFGLADEAGGAIATGLDYGQRLMNRLGLAGKSPGQINEELKAQGFTGDLASTAPEIYRQGQKETEADFAKSEERSPWLYKGGELAAGIASGIAATPSLAASGDAKLLEILNKQGYGAFGKEALKRAGVAAAEAAPAGLVAGAGYSEGKLVGATPEEQERLLEDTLKGGATAGALAGGIKLASDVAPVVAKKASEKIDDLVKDSDYLRQAKKSYDIGRRGDSLYGKSTDKALRAKEIEQANELGGMLNDPVEKLGQNIEDVLTKAGDIEGKIVKPGVDTFNAIPDLKQFLFENQTKLGSSKVNKIVKNLDDFTEIGLHPKDAYYLRRDLKELAHKFPDLKFIADDYAENLKIDISNKVDDFNKALGDYSTYKSSLEGIKSKGLDVPEKYQYGNVDKKDILEFSKNIIRKIGKPGSGQDDLRDVVDALYKNLEKNPELLKKTGLDLDKIKNLITEGSDSASIRKSIHRTEPHSAGLKQIVAETGQGWTYGASFGAGKIANKLGKMSQWPAEKLSSVAQKLKTGTSKHLGEALENAIAKGDKFKQNAVIFTILQTPSAKSELEGEFQSDEGAE